MNIRNDQGLGSSVIDAVAPFLETIADVLPLFCEPDVYVGDGAVVASIYLYSKNRVLSGDALGKVLTAAQKVNLPVCVSAVADQGIEVAIYGFILSR